ncbi:MAG: hypothetical protein K2G73_01605 [Eubacterium sp.]|nr:hypothetical protein [Eubacterium sp.]
MKKIIETENADKLFEKLSDNPLFSTEKSTSGLNVRYNAVFTVIGNPKINLIKLSDKSVKVDILPNVLMLLLAAAITIFFWVIAVLGIFKEGFPLGGIITAFVAPVFMWILEYIFTSKISEMIIEAIEKLNYK